MFFKHGIWLTGQLKYVWIGQPHELMCQIRCSVVQLTSNNQISSGEHQNLAHNISKQAQKKLFHQIDVYISDL